MPKRSVAFVEASHIEVLGSHEYKATVHPDYSLGPAANGGYAVSLLGRTVAAHFATTLKAYHQPDTISFHNEFLLPVTLGDAAIHVQDVRLGKASSTLHVTMTQKGKLRMGAYFTNTNRSLAKGISKPLSSDVSLATLSPNVPAVDFGLLLQHKDPTWTFFTLPYQDPKYLSNCIFAMQKEPCPDRSITQQWLGLSNPAERWKTDMLPIACDMYVPALENFYEGSDRSIQAFARQSVEFAAAVKRRDEREEGADGTEPVHRASEEWKPPRWYTTVNMSVDVKRALPEEGVDWLFTRMKTNEVVDGRLDVQAMIFDEQGRLVALASYVWVVVETEGLAAGRAKKEGGAGKSKM